MGDFQVCDFALLYCVFSMISVLWGELYGSNIHSPGGFKAKVSEVRERLQEGERWHVEGARQSRENITRIAPSGPFREVEYV